MPPRGARKAGNQRFYDWKGERFWSVTTISKGGLPEGFGLAKWKRSIVAKGAVEAVESGILVPMVERSPEGAVEFLAELPYTRTRQAADLGTEVHEAIEARVLGRPAPDPSEEAAPYLEQFAAFEEQYEVTFEAAEATVYNRTHSYAGTLDSIVAIDGRRYVLDVKTGAGVYPEVALQLAAYKHAEFIGVPDGSEQPMPETADEGLCLHLQPDWFEPHRVDISEPVFNVFLYARETFRWDLKISKGVFRGRLLRPSEDDAAAFTPQAEALFASEGY